MPRIIKKSQTKFIIASMILIVIILALSMMWNFCVPDGCVFSVRAECGTSECMGESVSDHIQERANLFLALPGQSVFTILSAILLITSLLTIGAPFLNRMDLSFQITTYVRLFETKIFDPFLDALSNGRINPQVYPSH